MQIGRHHIRLFILTFLVSLGAASCGGGKETDSDSASDSIPPARARVSAPAAQSPCGEGRIFVNNIGRLKDVFNDSNKYQYEYAELLGLQPIENIYDTYHTRRPVVRITTCEDYKVDSLTHSLPYLVPEAAKLLSDIGRNFKDSLASRGAGGYRVKVTSMLRTAGSVKKLRRVNVNATDSSTHKFGTTFDLSYTKFDCLDESHPIHDGDLKNLLAEVLLDLRNRNRCLVKFERKTGCFHITCKK